MTIYAVCFRINGTGKEMQLSLHKERESAESMMQRLPTVEEQRQFYYIKEEWLCC